MSMSNVLSISGPKYSTVTASPKRAAAVNEFTAILCNTRTIISTRTQNEHGKAGLPNPNPRAYSVHYLTLESCQVSSIATTSW